MIVVISWVELQVVIWPTVSHATDLGYIPVVVADALGYRDQAAAQRALGMVAFMGTAVTTESAALAQI